MELKLQNGQIIVIQDSDVMYAYHEPVTNAIGKASRLKNVLKVPVTLVAEMVQKYAKSELPWLADKLPKDLPFIKIFKPWTEIKKAYQDLVDRGITELPFVMPHTSATFCEDQIPSDVKAYIKDFIDPKAIQGYVKDFYLDEDHHKLKGFVYLKIADHDPEFIAKLENGIIVDVSIGFICAFDSGGIFNGEDYLLTQIDWQIGHLAGLVHERGKCPSGVCGLNQDHQKSTEQDRISDSLLQYLPHIVAEYDMSKIDQTKDNSVGIPRSVETTDNLHTNILPIPVVPIYPSLPTVTKVDTMAPDEIDSYKKQIADLQKQLADQQTSALNAKVQAQVQEIHDVGIKLESMKNLKDKLETDMAECKKKSEEKDVEIAKLKAKKREEMVPLIDKAFGKERTWHGKKATELCDHDIELVFDDAKAVLDQNLIATGAPKPAQDAHTARLTGNEKKPEDTKASSTISAEDYASLSKVK